MRVRAVLSTAVRIAVAAALLAVLIHQFGGGRALLDNLRGLPLAALVAALAANTADRLLMTWKWTLLLRVRGQELGLLEGTRIYCTSMVWGMFLPATMGSDAVRAVSTVRHGLRAADVLASIVIERALGVLASLVVGLLGLLAVWMLGDLPPALAPVWWMGGLALGGGGALVLLSFSDRFDRWVYDGLLTRWIGGRLAGRARSFHDTYRSYRGHPRVLWTFFGLSTLQQLGPFVPLWILARAMGLEVSALYLAGAVTLSFLVARVPVSLGGLGVLEGALVLLLSLEGVPGPQAVALAVSGRVLEVVSWLPWWISLVLRRRRVGQPQGEPWPVG